MNRMKNFFFLLLLCFALPLCAQEKTPGVEGRVCDSLSREALGYATVVAVDGRGRNVAAAVSLPDGVFRLLLKRSGAYTLHFSMAGYGVRILPLHYAGEGLDLGEIALQAGVEIETVVVEPLLRVESDRIVYDVGRDPDAAKMRMMRFMSKVPLLKMDPATGNLLYNDMSIEKILFDGRNETLISSSRQYPMEFIRADVMGTIEVILPGSPEYNNDKPMINIKLDRPLPSGIAGQLSPRYTTDGTHDSGLDVVTKNRLGTIGFNYGFGYKEAPRLGSDTERIRLDDGQDAETQAYRYTGRNRQWAYSMRHNLRLDLSRKLFRDHLSLTARLRTSQSDGVSHSVAASQNFDRDEALIDQILSQSRSRNRQPFRLGGTLGAQVHWGVRTSSQLFANYDFSDSRSNLDTRSMRSEDAAEEVQKSLSATDSRQHALTVTYLFRPQGRRRFSLWGGVTAGYINSFYRNSAEYYLFDPLTGEFEADEARFDGLDYRQQIVSAAPYAMFSLFKRKLLFSTNVNLEHVMTDGVYRTTGGSKLDYSRTNVLPRLSINHRYKQNTRFGFEYKTRVKRPSVAQLNPYVDDSDPGHIRRGNPALKGEYAHRLRFSANRNFKSEWFNSLGVTYAVEFADELINRVTTVTDDNVAVTSYYNMGRSVMQECRLSCSMRPVTWLNLFLNAGYRRSKYHFPNRTDNTVEGVYGSATMAVRLKGTDFLRVGYSCAPAYASSQNVANSYYSTLDISIQHYFPKLRLGGTIGADDLLNGRKSVRDVIASTAFRQTSFRQRIGRTVSFSLYWRFGKFRNPIRAKEIDSGIYDMDTPGLLED